MAQDVAYHGKHCEYVRLSWLHANSGCDNGDKFVLKTMKGIRKQFLIMNNEVILAFLTNGIKFPQCRKYTDVTSKVKCKAVTGLSHVNLPLSPGIKQLAPVKVLRDEAKFKREAMKVVENSGKAAGNIEIGLFKEEGASGQYAFFETWKTLGDANTDNQSPSVANFVTTMGDAIQLSIKQYKPVQ